MSPSYEHNNKHNPESSSKETLYHTHRLIDKEKCKIDKDNKKLYRSNTYCKFTKEERSVLMLSLNNSMESMRNKTDFGIIKPQIKFMNTIKLVKRVAKKYSLFFSNSHLNTPSISPTKNSQLPNIQKYINKEITSKIHHTQKKQLKELQKHSQQLLCDETKLQDMKSMFKQTQETERYSYNRLQIYLQTLKARRIVLPQRVKRQHETLFSRTTATKPSSTPNPSLLSPTPSEHDSFNEEVLRELPYRKTWKTNTASSTDSKILTNRWYTSKTMHEFKHHIDYLHNNYEELHRELAKHQSETIMLELIGNIEYAPIIKQIYLKCETDPLYFTNRKIKRLMDKYPGIVSSLRYLSNNIKTRIVDDREKRFTKINKHISQAQDSITRKVKTIIKGLKSFDNPSLTTSYGISTINMKQSIIKSMQKTLTIHINHGNR